MISDSESPTWHGVICAAGVVGFALLAGPSVAQTVAALEGDAKAGATETAIRPFRIDVPDEALVDLRRRVLMTRWPDRETVSDQSQGVKLDKIQELVRYWVMDYDWRKVEARLNALPQFVTKIDGLDIHFIHVRSPHANALPLLITHGWPGSVLELVKAIGPLTDPTSYGGRAEDAFDVVIPVHARLRFLRETAERRLGPRAHCPRVGRTDEAAPLHRYVSQGGDWGSVVADAMARQAPAGLLGIHVNMPPTVPAHLVKAINSGDPAPAGLSDKEKAAFESLSTFFAKNAGYGAMMVTRPQTVGYGLSDSPVGLAAWMYDKFAQWTYSGGEPERVLTKEAMLDDITLYWLTNSAISSARLYWENNNDNFSAGAQKTAEISLPVAVTVFPGEIYRAPKSWTRAAYRNLIYFNEVDNGGHFAAWEQPELFAKELRAAFKSLR